MPAHRKRLENIEFSDGLGGGYAYGCLALKGMVFWQNRCQTS
jgi:hypothetical protein